MATASHVVLYAMNEDGSRRVLGSVETGARNARILVSHFASKAMRESDNRGVPHPVLVAMQETREGETEKNTSGRYIVLDVDTLKPAKEGDRGETDLEVLFKKVAKGISDAAAKAKENA